MKKNATFTEIVLILQLCSLFDDVDDNVPSRRTLTASLRLIAYTNCAVNPLVYCLLNERFKATLKKLAATVKLCRPRSGGRDHAHQLTATDRSRMVAGPTLRLGLLVTREAAMSVVDIPRTTRSTKTEAQMATRANDEQTVQTTRPTYPFLTKY